MKYAKHEQPQEIKSLTRSMGHKLGTLVHPSVKGFITFRDSESMVAWLDVNADRVISVTWKYGRWIVNVKKYRRPNRDH